MLLRVILQKHVHALVRDSNPALAARFLQHLSGVGDTINEYQDDETIESEKHNTSSPPPAPGFETAKKVPYRIISKRQEELENIVLASASRLLENDDDIEHEDDSNDEDHEVDIPASEELLQGIQKRRKLLQKRIPATDDKVLGLWYNDNESRLGPFIAFIKDIGLSEERMIRSLFSAGYKGRQAMLPAQDDAVEESTDEQLLGDVDTNNDDEAVADSFKEDNSTADQPSQHDEQQQYFNMEDTYNEETSVAEQHYYKWVDALKEQGMHIDFAHAVRKRPHLLSVAPDRARLAALFQMLKSVLGEIQLVQELVSRFPRVLVYKAMAIESQLIFLSLHMPHLLTHVISEAPEVLTTPRAIVEKNIQWLTQSTPALAHFYSVVEEQPHLLRQRNLARLGQKKLDKLSEVLPNGLAQLVLSAEPELFFAPRGRLLRGWNGLKEHAAKYINWTSELDELIQKASEQSVVASLSKDSPVKTLAAMINASPKLLPRLNFILEQAQDNAPEETLKDILLADDVTFVETYPTYKDWLDQRAKHRQRLHNDDEYI